MTKVQINENQIYNLADLADRTGDGALAAICQIALYGSPDEPGTLMGLLSDDHLTSLQIAARRLLTDRLTGTYTLFPV